MEKFIRQIFSLISEIKDNSMALVVLVSLSAMGVAVYALHLMSLLIKA